jgi:hypothetical protein
MLKEPADTFADVKVGGAEAGTVKVMVRSERPTIRRLERAPRTTEGAREVKAEWPW